MFTPLEAINRLCDKREIFYDEMVDLMRQVMEGKVSPVQLSAILINRNSTAHHNLQTVFGTKAQQSRRRPKHHHSNLRVPIFKSEIKMPRVMRPEIGNLPFHPGIAILALNMSTNRRHQITHRPYAAIEWLKTESKLVGGGHCSGVYNTTY